MPEDKPWEKYNSAPTDTGKPWNSYQSSGNKWENFTPDVKDNPDQLENTLNDIVKTSRTKILDSEKDVLRDILKNPNTTPEQAKEAIQTMQGYHPKFENGKTQYYLKQDNNGVLVPKPLAYGEKPPKGYNVPSVWGTRKEAEDDAWYTDMGKSLFNGVLGAVGGVADLAQLGTTTATGEESKALNSTGNVIDAFKFEKDPELNKPLYNTEGIEKWADVLDKERLDISPESLWGTLNMVGESATSFFTGAGAAAKLGKGIAGVEQLGKAGIGASAFTGSFLTQLGDNIDNAKEAGLEGRDIVKFALPTTAIQASIDAAFGLEAKIFSSSFKKAEKELMKELGRSIEKDAAGQITKEGFKQLAKGTTVGYGELAKVGLKEIGKDAGREMFQEMGQDFTAKAAENLWDKLSDEDKGKFGTNALDAKSFGSYIQNGLAGLVGGVPMALASTDYKKKYDEQSINALEVVKGGDSKITETKANLALARDKGQITPQEYDNAVFKIDAYNNYWGQTKDLHLSDAEKKETFELSFNIQGLQNEIPKDVESLDPIAIAKINTKKELIKGLQKELDNILLKQEIQKETKAGQATVNKVAKDNGLENEKKEGEEKKDLSLDELLKKIRSTKADKIDVEKTPRRKMEEVDLDEWNDNNKTSSLQRKQILQEHLKDTPNNEIDATLQEGENGTMIAVLPDGKKINMAQSAENNTEPGKGDFMKRENLPATREEGVVVDRGGNTAVNEEGKPLFSYKEPVKIKRVEITAYDEKGKVMKDENGKPKKKAVLSVYNPANGGHIIFAREVDKKGFHYKSSKYHPKEIEQLEAIRNANHIGEDIKPYVRGAEPQPAAKVAKVAKEPKAKPDAPKRPYVKPYQEDLSNIQLEKFGESGYSSDVIQPALEETNRLLNLPTEELFQELYNLGIFNSVGEKFDWRPDTGLSTEQFNRTLEQIAEGKPSKTTEQLYDYVDSVKKSGDVSMIGHTGGQTQKYNQPLFYFVLDSGKFDQRQLSPEEEAAEMDKLQAQAQFEAQQQKERAVKGDAFKVIERLKKVAPKVNWVYDNKLKAAAQVKGNIITVNPFYAGLDTPIHEVGHILIDTLGYNSKLIQSAIKQLKTTELWAITKKKYDGLSEEQLGKEVLAEAIGREGAGIFDSVKEQSKFKQILDYIFARLKQFFGMDKNVAKSLAQQIMSGIGTSNLEGKNDMVQEQRTPDEVYKINKIIDQINKGDDMSDFTNDDLINTYNYIITADGVPKGKAMRSLMIKIAMNFFNRRVAELESNPEFSIERAKTKDITYKDVKFKVLSHFTDSFPELQELSKMWDAAYFAKVKEAKEEKRTNEKLAIEVIKDRNKKLGIVERGKELFQKLFSNVNHKYFDYLDNSKGKLITLDEAKSKGLSKAQIDYLIYVREILSQREKLIENPDIYNMDLEVLMLDKKFSESLRTEGLTQAFSSWLTTSHRLSETIIEFKNPLTGKTEMIPFKDVEKVLIEYGNKGIIEKAKSLALLTKYNFAARRKLKDAPNKLRGEYLLDEDGKLQSKFNKPRDKNRSYSKDFYSAIQEYIDDSTHIKHISPLVPIVDAIEYLNHKGVYKRDEDDNVVAVHEKKPNVVKWINEWRDLHILKKPEETIPELDAALKFLRFMTSATTMMFNVPAGAMNAAIGNYNNWRSEGLKTWVKGQGRLFLQGKRKKSKDYGFGAINPYAVDIARKYGAVSTDVDSNPLQTAGGILNDLGHVITKYGEFQIQATGLLGLMSDVDYNSFEYKTNKNGVEELVVKEGVDEKKLEERILNHINSVSDVQGKYSDKDRRNIMNNELGKALLQFKVYLPDWYRIRYGENGSWTKLYRKGLSGLKKDIQEKGWKEAIWNDKDVMTNLKGAVTVAFFMALSYGDDDDKEKKGAAQKVDKALGNLLVIFDPDQLKFTLTRPIAAMGVIEKFINAADHLAAFEQDDFYKADGKYGEKGDSKLPGDILQLTPAHKLTEIPELLNDEE